MKFSSTLSRHGLQQSTSDPCLLIGKSKDVQDVYTMVYVDYVIIASKSKEASEEIFATMRQSFELITTDDTHSFLGIKIERKRYERKLWILQQAYLKKILRRLDLQKIHAKIPIEKGR